MESFSVTEKFNWKNSWTFLATRSYYRRSVFQYTSIVSMFWNWHENPFSNVCTLIIMAFKQLFLKIFDDFVCGIIEILNRNNLKCKTKKFYIKGACSMKRLSLSSTAYSHVAQNVLKVTDQIHLQTFQRKNIEWKVLDNRSRAYLLVNIGFGTQLDLATRYIFFVLLIRNVNCMDTNFALMCMNVEAPATSDIGNHYSQLDCFSPTNGAKSAVTVMWFTKYPRISSTILF